MLRNPIKHCKQCGTVVVYRLPDDGDTKERAMRNFGMSRVHGTWRDDRRRGCARNG